MLYLCCSAALQSHSKVERAEWGRFLKDLFLSSPMNKPLAGCQLQWIADEKFPSLPGDQADDCPVGEGEKKAPVISCGQGQETCSSAKRSLSASSRKQLDSISGSASPAARMISPWFQQQKSVQEERRGGRWQKNANGR